MGHPLRRFFLDPNATGSHKLGLFGVPTTREQAAIVLIPVPWEVTTSYGSGTSRGPEAILHASAQVDLFDRQIGRSYERGYHLLPQSEKWLALNDELKPKAMRLREELEEKGELSAASEKILQQINRACADMSDWVYETAKKILSEGKIPAVIGGDHSSPEGLIRAICEDNEVGILHVDAHADLRVAYQGFTRSHASIMHNVMSAKSKPTALVQVAIRDFCEEEFNTIADSHEIHTIFDQDIKTQLFEGQKWSDICEDIIRHLPEKVYLSIDIDGLSPEFCPNTGTPVPGGLSFDQLNYLFSKLVMAKRKIVGFDLNEVAPSEGGSEWDANVGARLLYKMCGWTVLSQHEDV
jgi:agmatinase